MSSPRKKSPSSKFKLSPAEKASLPRLKKILGSKDVNHCIYLLRAFSNAHASLLKAKTRAEAESILIVEGNKVWTHIAGWAEEGHPESVDWLASTTCEGADLIARLLKKPKLIPVFNDVAKHRTSWPVLKSPVAKYNTDHKKELARIQLDTEGKRPLNARSKLDTSTVSYKYAVRIWKEIQRDAFAQALGPNRTKVKESDKA